MAQPHPQLRHEGTRANHMAAMEAVCKTGRGLAAAVDVVLTAVTASRKL